MRTITDLQQMSMILHCRWIFWGMKNQNYMIFSCIWTSATTILSSLQPPHSLSTMGQESTRKQECGKSRREAGRGRVVTARNTKDTRAGRLVDHWNRHRERLPSIDHTSGGPRSAAVPDRRRDSQRGLTLTGGAHSKKKITRSLPGLQFLGA